MKHNTIRITFYGDLHTFLSRRFSSFFCRVKDRPSIKNLVESLGVPHTEVDALFANGKAVGFSYLVCDKDSVRVYPDSSRVRFAPVKKLQPSNLRNPKFIVDVHLGKVAKMLRLLGFDVFFDSLMDDGGILDESLKNKRIILTRDRGILKQRQARYGYYVRGDTLKDRMKGIIKRYELKDKIKPLTRCCECNGKLTYIRKEEILSQLEPLTRKHYDKFYRYASCDKIYWQGSHFPSLLAGLKSFISGGT